MSVSKLISRGFMTTVTGDGNPYLQVRFADLKDVYALANVISGIAAFEAENAKLREALRPFAEELSKMENGAYNLSRWSDGLSIDDSTNDPSGITLGDLRRAREALTAPTPPPQP